MVVSLMVIFIYHGSLESVKNHLKDRKTTQEAPIFQLFHRVFPSATAFLIFPTIKVTIKTTFSGHLEREKGFSGEKSIERFADVFRSNFFDGGEYL